MQGGLMGKGFIFKRKRKFSPLEDMNNSFLASICSWVMDRIYFIMKVYEIKLNNIVFVKNKYRHNM